MDDSKPSVNWIRAIDTAQLQRRGRAVVKLDGKQLALFAVGDRIFACNNRCPHEGYPLVEGHLQVPQATNACSPATGTTGSLNSPQAITSTRRCVTHVSDPACTGRSLGRRR